MNEKNEILDSQTDALGTENIKKLIFRLGAPAIAAQLINMLYNMVDRMYIGHIEGIGKLALTGVGVCLPIILIISAFAALFGMGGAPRASIFLGRGDKTSGERILGNSFTLLVASSLILTAAIELWAQPLLFLFGASENTIDYALDYILIYGLGTVFVQLTLGLNQFISAQGFAKTSMLTVLIGAICNIVLDPIFIFALNMGVKGAALATIISQCISTVWILIFLSGKKTVLRLRLKYMLPVPRVFLPCIALGVSPFIMQSTESLLSVCFNTSLQKYGGDLAVGSMTILTSVFQLAFLPLAGLSQGVSPIISYNYGAKNAGRIREAFRLLLLYCVIYVSVIWAAIQLFPQAFVNIFNNDAELVDYASRALRIYTSTLIVMGVQISCQQSFIALGNAKYSILGAVMRKIIILIPMIYILPAVNIVPEKDIAVFMAEPVSDVLAATFTAILFAVYFKKVMAEIEPAKDRWKQSRYFEFLRKAIMFFTGPMKTTWQEEFDGEPSVFVCNHDRAYGPIAMCVQFDHCRELRPWINHEVLSFKTMPAYVRQDYWYPPDKWYTKILDYTAAYFYSLIIPPIMRGSACIPVYHDTGVMSTLRASVDAIKHGYHIMLFPEHPSGYGEYSADVFTGFVSLGRLVQRRTGKAVSFYPTYVDWKAREIRVGAPIRYNSGEDFEAQAENISRLVAEHFEKKGK